MRPSSVFVDVSQPCILIFSVWMAFGLSPCSLVPLKSRYSILARDALVRLTGCVVPAREAIGCGVKVGRGVPICEALVCVVVHAVLVHGVAVVYSCSLIRSRVC